MVHAALLAAGLVLSAIDLPADSSPSPTSSMLTLQKFVETHTPGPHLRKASSRQLRRYRDRLPAPLLDLWAKVGFGTYAGGLVQLIDPDEYKSTLEGWLLLDEDDPSRIPIALSAFGILFYYRDLGNGAEDIAFIDPRTSASEVAAWSLEAFFNDYLCQPATIDTLLEAPRCRVAVATQGPLKPGQVYCLSPARRIGGSDATSKLERGDAVTYLHVLLQLALAE